MHSYFTRIFCSVGFALGFTFSAQAEEVTLDQGAVTLLADFVEAEDAGETVVLITHGTFAHKDMELVEALQAALSEHGVSSLAHTLSMGVSERRGMYDCTVPHTHRDEDADKEIAAWIDWLHEKGHQNIALVGHSRGGKQVARTAATRDDLAGVVLMAPATTASAKRQMAFRPVEITKALVEVASDASEPVSLSRFVYCEDATVTPDALRSYYPDNGDGADTYAPELTVPVLVIAGSEDTVVPEVPEIFDPMQGDRLRLEVVEDADHMFLDFFAEDAADLIAEFVTDLPPASNSVPDFAAADIAYGEYLGQECLSCHAPQGSNSVPTIHGGDAEHLYLALIEYAEGIRENPAMRLVARSLDDEQRIAIAAYFASLEHN